MAEATFPIIRLTLDETAVEFQGDAIMECSVLQETDPIGASLPVSTASVLIFTTDPRFSIYSDGTFYQALTKNLPMTLLVWVDGVGENIGTFYLSDWKMESENTLRFELVDALGVCAGIDYPGSFWETDTVFTTIIQDIMDRVPFEFYIDNLIRDRTLKGWIPPSSVRDALQQVCFAARSTVTTDRTNKLIFRNASMPLQELHYLYPPITDTEKTDEQTVIHLPKINDIIVISHDYYNLGEIGQTVDEIYSSWLEPGNYIISYKKPYWKVWGEGAGAVPLYVSTEDDRVITTEDSGSTWTTARIAAESETFVFRSNYVSVQVDVAGQITLWGYPWLSADRPHRYSDETDNLNSVTIENAMMLDSTNALLVLEELSNYYALRHKTTIQLFPKELALGSIYKIDSIRSRKLLAIAERFEIDLTNGYITSATFTGMEYVPETT